MQLIKMYKDGNLAVANIYIDHYPRHIEIPIEPTSITKPLCIYYRHFPIPYSRPLSPLVTLKTNYETIKPI